MTDPSPKINGKYLRFERCETGAEFSHGDALIMRKACEAWLKKNDPTYLDRTFSFGSVRQKRRGA
jgi:hypothetical protein